MNKTAKAYLLIGASGFAFIYAFTSPIIQIYFMKLVDSITYILAYCILSHDMAELQCRN